MNRITSFLKAVYSFFAGDFILLTAVAVAFIVAALLTHVAHLTNLVTGVIFVAIIVGGLVTTEVREIAGRPRTR